VLFYHGFALLSGVGSRSLPIRKRHAGIGPALSLASAIQEPCGTAPISPSHLGVDAVWDPEVALGHEAPRRRWVSHARARRVA
jgi:hypothetical protein